MMRRTLLLVAVGVNVLALAVGAALATQPSGGTPPPSKVTATQLTRATLGEFKAKYDGIKVKSLQRSADIAISKVVIEPGGSTGWHHHPGVVMVPVEAGTVTEYDAQCHKTVIQAGEGFVESNGEVHLARNEGDVKAVLYATFLVPTNTPPDGLTIADPKPRGCNVS
jgi:quercetin dioxygenase-like cupin family protein